MVRDLTVDVGVLMAASGLGALEHHDASLKLADRIIAEDGWGVALDSRGRIRYQYEQKLRPDSFGRVWLARAASTGKVTEIPWKGIDRGTRTALKEAHFDPEDFKYVETASQTTCKELVSHDPDYSPNVRTILRWLNVTVVSANESIAV